MTIATFPLTIIADDREGAPYTFDGLGDTHVVRKRLETGDYSLPFCGQRVAVSRKSLDDLYATVLDSARLMRFEAELARMERMEAGCVVVEGDPFGERPPGRDDRHQWLVTRRVELLRMRHPRLTWVNIAGRRGGEIITYAFLRAFRERTERSEWEVPNDSG